MEYGRQNPPCGENSNETKIYSILSYIGILWIVGLIAAPRSPEVRFHVNQGIILTIFELVIRVALFIIKTVISIIFILPFHMLPFVPNIGLFINSILSFAFWCLTVVYIIIGITHVVQNRMEPLPIIGSLFNIIH